LNSGEIRMRASEDNKTKTKALLMPVLWVVIALLVMGGATFAWFSFSTRTKIKPMAGTIGDSGVTLLISNSESGPFEESTDLIVEGTTENLQPVSTGNLNTWYTSLGNNAAGISDTFSEVTETIDEKTMYGTLYLKSEGGECNVYFDPEAMYFGDDDQLIASCRLGLVIKTVADGEKSFIFKLDSLGNTGGAESQETMDSANVVVTGVDSSGRAETDSDPSEEMTAYNARISGEAVEPGETVLCRLGEDEIASVDFRLYMEGCDENTINASQDREISIKMGFAGTSID